MMIKQRNANITNQNKLTFDKLKQQSPFNRSNPYRVKAQFYSQRKRTITTTNTIDKNINNNDRKTSRQSNPQSLKYKRDYKQNPPTMMMFQYRQLKDNFIQVKNNILTRNLSRGIDDQLEEQQYRLRLKQFVANKFCPSDPYLQIVKDKFNYISTQNSQFQNTMKMSNLGISNLTTNNNKYTPQSGISYKDRLNPFYRKNLISSNNNTQLLYESQYNGSTAYKWQYFPQIIDSSRVTSYYQYNSVAAGPSISHYQHMNSNVYQISIPPPYDPKHNKQHRSSSYSQQSASRVSNGTFNNNGQQSQNVTQKQNPSPKSSLAASFGPDYQWKVNGMIRPYVDAVIEHHLQDPLNIQSKAPKQIKIKGKTFYLNYVNRFMN